MRRVVFLIADAALLLMFVVLVIGLCSDAYRKKSAGKKIVGVWCMESEEGAVTSYYTFSADGELKADYEIRTGSGEFFMDASSFGEVRYQITGGDTLRLTERIMGIEQVEEYPLTFDGNDVLKIGDDTYYRYRN